VTLLSELIDLPREVHKSDFVISLADAVHDPAGTVRDYVVTDQLAACFDRALSLVGSAVADGKSKATYLHASFGAGKTAMMAVLYLLLQGDPTARAIRELQPVVARHASWIDGRRYLLVPYHFVGASSMEQVVLGGYVTHLRRVHPDAALPAVYMADGILADATAKRSELGDETFLRVLSQGEVADEWGDYGSGWDPGRFEAALAAPPGSGERDQLVGALLRTHYRALPGHAQTTAEGFVPLAEGLDAVSRHARSLGYDAVIMLLDELVLWLAARMSDVAFVTREGAKVVKLVEADSEERPAPIISFIARQRDLRELVGDHVPGAQSLTAIDILRHSEGRFDTITLEDRNLPAIASRRLLRPRSEAAVQALDDAFATVSRQVEERRERDVLLTDTGDAEAFRRLYPFSPALVEALVALSGAMQRERTALKVMAQLLAEGRDRLQVGDLIPLGDLWDAIDTGDEPLTEVMRAQFAQARRMWKRQLGPMLARHHALVEDGLGGRSSSPAFVIDARLAKTLLIAALVPEVPVLRNLTVSRLTALNSGIVRTLIPGTERTQVLDRLQAWQAEIPELHLAGDEQDPTVTLALTGIDTGPLLDAAGSADTPGERRRQVRELLVAELDVKDPASFEPSIEVVWRGTRRRVAVLFGNVRDATELPDEMLRAGPDPKIVVDFPWDTEGFGPADDRSRVDEHRRTHDPEWTAVWLPNFLTEAAYQKLGQLVRLGYLLTGDTFDRLAGYLSPTDRPVARTQLDNQRTATLAQLQAALRQAYGVERADEAVVSEQLSLGDQFLTLDPGLGLRPPVGTSLRSFAEHLAGQLLAHRFPRHPDFVEHISRADLVHTRDQVTAALAQDGHRLEAVESSMRRVLARVAGPLGVGTMYQSHFVADLGRWSDLVGRASAAAGASAVTVGQLRRWLDGAESPSERRGLTPEVADLVIILVAEATGQALVAAGRPVARPEIGRVRDDWELRAQELPDEAVWNTALVRAEAMGVVATSRLRSATAVVDLAGRLGERLLAESPAVRDLVAQLEAAAARLGVDADADRLRTARAARELVDEMRRRPERAAEVLAAAVVPTTTAALGTSIATAAALAAELGRANWSLLGAAANLADPWQSQGLAVATRLSAAVAADELVVALGPRLDDAGRAATDLLARASHAAAPAGPPPAAAPIAGEPAAATALPIPPPPRPAGTLDRTAAEAELTRLADRLRVEAGLDLRWSIEELPGAGC